MKKKFFTVLAALALFALAFAGCNTGGEDGGGNNDPNDPNNPNNPNNPAGSANTTLSGIKIGGSDAVVGTANSKKTIAELAGNAMKDFNVSFDDKDTAVEFVKGAAFLGTIKYAHTNGAVPAETDFLDYNESAKPDTLNLTDGDKIYVQMTSGNKKETAYYGFNILIGWDAKLKEEKGLVFGGRYSPTLGTAVEDLGDFDTDAEAETGKMQFSRAQPSPNGFTVTANPSDKMAKVFYNFDGLATWTELYPTSSSYTPKKFDEGDFIYIKVVSQNTHATLYYKIEIIPLRSVTIPYGTPKNADGTLNLDINNGVVTASQWDDASDWLPINRVNTTEGKGILNMPADKTRSHGRAKLMWDVNGIWIYAQVWEQTVSKDPGNHENSSIELFINEKYNVMLDDTTGFPSGPSGTVAADPNTNGGQYRLGANGERTAPQSNQTAAFNALNRSKAVKYLNNTTNPGTMPDSPQKNGESGFGAIGTEITTGYVLVYQAPWLFFDDYQLGENKMVGIEIQINATGDNGNRVGVLNWNSASTHSYTSLAAFGEGTLVLNGKEMDARKPKITTQPAAVTVVNLNGTVPALTVVATSPDTGTLSYQWYEAASPTDFDGATPVSGATSASFTPTISTSAEGVHCFFAEVTNFVSEGNLNTVNTAMARIVAINTSAPIDVDLSQQVYDAAKWDTAGVGNRVTGTYDSTTKSITWEFGKDTDAAKNGDQRVAIKLTDAQAAYIQSAKALEVKIEGSATPGSTAKYRCYIGTISTQNSWNGTDAFPANSAFKFSDITTPTGANATEGGAHKVKMSGNIASDGRGDYFILRSSAAGVDSVTITKITITPKDKEW